MKVRFTRVIALATGLIALSCLADTSPKLVLQITVDQLKGSALEKYNFDGNGFNYLLANGVQYKNAHHNHANTETIVGHTTLATGAPPSIHGMIGNAWYDKSLKRLVYNIEDSQYPLLSANADVNQQTEIDPTQKAAKASGRSPENIMVSTIADEITIASAQQAKVFAVSVKDRGAVSMAGHSGKAFWFSKSKGEFVSSQYYYQQYPQWVNNWNSQKPTQVYADKSWRLFTSEDKYQLIDQDDNPWETDLAGFGRTFPHSYGAGDNKYFTTKLTLSPAGDELTASFAKAIIEHERLGQDLVTDYLAVSFSSTDYVGHIFGPNSLEAEDNLLWLDKTLEDLFNFIDKKVGLKNTLIVLSSDHGSAPVPAQLTSMGIKAKNITAIDWEEVPGIKRLKAELGIQGKLIDSFHPPYLYLNLPLLDSMMFDIAKVQGLVAEKAKELDGIALAIASNHIEQGMLPKMTIAKAVANNHFPKRAGDVYIVFDSHRFINEMDGLTVASHHGSPWRYDTHVPLIFAGNGIRPKTLYRKVETLDLAPTVSAWLEISPPSGAMGNVLTEVAEQKD